MLAHNCALVKFIINEPPHDKTNKLTCAPSEDSDQPGHPPCLIRVFTVRMKEAWVLSYPLSAQRRLWSDWADAQADLSLRWANSHFVGFVMSRLKWFIRNLLPLLCSSGKPILHVAVLWVNPGPVTKLIWNYFFKKCMQMAFGAF